MVWGGEDELFENRVAGGVNNHADGSAPQNRTSIVVNVKEEQNDEDMQRTAASYSHYGNENRVFGVLFISGSWSVRWGGEEGTRK